jgi:hypothetical protein
VNQIGLIPAAVRMLGSIFAKENLKRWVFVRQILTVERANFWDPLDEAPTERIDDGLSSIHASGYRHDPASTSGRDGTADAHALGTTRRCLRRLNGRISPQASWRRPPPAERFRIFLASPCCVRLGEDIGALVGAIELLTLGPFVEPSGAAIAAIATDALFMKIMQKMQITNFIPEPVFRRMTIFLTCCRAMKRAIRCSVHTGR